MEPRADAKRNEFQIYRSSNPRKRQRGELSKIQVLNLEIGKTRRICFRCPQGWWSQEWSVVGLEAHF